MTQLLTENSKMKKTSHLTGVRVYDFAIPAFMSKDGTKTCPMARHCVAGCYARAGAYLWTNTKNALENKLTATKRDDFVDVMSKLITQKSKRGKIAIRIHSSGDFYSLTYMSKWLNIIERHPNVIFYAYTKSISMVKSYQTMGLIPDNFKIIYSFGGWQDQLINKDNDRHALVVSDTAKNPKGYINASGNDLNAITKNKKVSLFYHGVKNYANTTWSKVV